MLSPIDLQFVGAYPANMTDWVLSENQQALMFILWVSDYASLVRAELGEIFTVFDEVFDLEANITTLRGGINFDE